MRTKRYGAALARGLHLTTNAKRLSVDERLESIAEAMRRGDYLAAFDRARPMLAPTDDVRFAYAAALALARSNATEQAAGTYERLLRRRMPELTGTLRTDVLALAARIAKDRAFRAAPQERRYALRAAAAAYADVFTATGAAYPAINAATLAALADERNDALHFAEVALHAAHGEQPQTAVDRFYQLSTIAEAQLILGDPLAARATLEHARAAAPHQYDAHATTRRQIERLARHLGAERMLAHPLAAPAAVHYSGHRFFAQATDVDASALAASVAAIFAELDVGFAFGSLAAGADIICAEAALARGAHLHVMLPYAREDFVRASVASSGNAWVARFESVLARADRITMLRADGFVGDDASYGYAARFAMGLAALQGAQLAGAVYQVALWDGVRGSDDAVAGTWADVLCWQRAGRRTRVVPMPTVARGDATVEGEQHSAQTTRVMMFGDIKGFSTLRDGHVLRFADAVFGACARVLDAFAGIELRNTWGDGLFVVMRDVNEGAECALQLQAALAALDLEALGLPPTLGLRLGAHFGPVFPYHDPITQTPNFLGEHVSRTARIEPVTPEGSVYVTEAFAAEISLRSGSAFRCDYVGEIDSAKGFGAFRMYALVREVAGES